jgi:hypothetical protein
MTAEEKARESVSGTFFLCHKLVAITGFIMARVSLAQADRLATTLNAGFQQRILSIKEQQDAVC